MLTVFGHSLQILSSQSIPWQCAGFWAYRNNSYNIHDLYLHGAKGPVGETLSIFLEGAHTYICRGSYCNPLPAQGDQACTAALRPGEHSSSKGPGQGCCSPGSVLCLEVESLLDVKGRPECYAKGYGFSYLSEHLIVLCSGGDGRVPGYYLCNI